MTDEVWTAAEYRRWQKDGIEPTRDKTIRLQTVTDLKDHTEACFQAMVIKIAEEAGWKVYHTTDSRKSRPGWPDLVLCRGTQAIFWECKTEKGKMSDAQMEWIQALQNIKTVEASMIRPSDLDVIRRILA